MLLEKYLAHGLLAVCGVTLGALPLAVWAGPAAALAWSAGVLVEQLWLLALACLLAVALRQPLAALGACAAVYVFARNAALFAALADEGLAAGGLQAAAAAVLWLSVKLVPDLGGLFTAGPLLEGGFAWPRPLPVAQALAWSALVLGLARDRLARRAL